MDSRLHGRRSIIKKRDEDDLTMTRPLSKRVSFSASNQTRLFSVDSGEPKRTTSGRNQSSLDMTASASFLQQTLNTSAVPGPGATWTTDRSGASGLMDISLAASGAEMDEDVDCWLDADSSGEEDTPMLPDADAPEVDAAVENDQSVMMDKPAVVEAAPNNFLAVPAAPHRVSSEMEDKTKLINLQAESTGTVRDELQKLAEHLLPAEPKSGLDLYDIKGTLQGRTQRKRQEESPPPVHEYTFANNTITGIRFSTIEPDTTICHGQTLPVSPPETAESPAEANSRRSSGASSIRSSQSGNSSINGDDASPEESSSTSGLSAEKSAESSCAEDEADGSEEPQNEPQVDITMEQIGHDEKDGPVDRSYAMSIMEPSIMGPTDWNRSVAMEATMTGMDTTSCSVQHEPTTDEPLSLVEEIPMCPSKNDMAEAQQNLSECQLNIGVPSPIPSPVDRSEPMSAEDANPESNSESIVNESLSQPGPEPQLDVSGVDKLDDSPQSFQRDPSLTEPATHSSLPSDATFTKDRRSYRPSMTTANISALCNEMGSARESRVTDIVNKTYDVVHSDAESNVQVADAAALHLNQDTSCLANEPEPSFADQTLFSCPSQPSQPPPAAAQTPRSLPSRMDFAVETPAIGTTQIDKEALFKQFPELLECMKTPTWVIPPLPPVTVSEIKLGMDCAELAKKLVIKENKELKTVLKKELRELEDIRDGFRDLHLSLKEALEQARAPPLLDIDRLEENAPAKDLLVNLDSYEKTATVIYQKFSQPLVKIECKEQNNGTIHGRVFPCEDDPDNEGLCALIPFAVMWAKRSLGRDGKSADFTAPSWAEIEKKLCSAVKLLNVNCAQFVGVEDWLDSVVDAKTGQRRVAFGGMVWRSREMKVFVDEDLREEVEVGPYLGKLDSSSYDLRMDEFRAAWKSDGVSTFLERINRVHDALLELSANETINAVQGAKHNL